MGKSPQVVIDSSSRIWYSSFYIQGLYELFGKNNVHFSSKPFEELQRKSIPYSFDHYMAFILKVVDGSIQKYVIDFNDVNLIHETAYKWSDVYGKINLHKTDAENKSLDKIISIPPSFAVKIWNLPQTAYYFISNLIRNKFSPLVSLKEYSRDYYYQYKRPELKSFLKDFQKTEESTDTRPYIFMVATLWPHKNCIEFTNIQRKLFVEACKKADCDFEGGFVVLGEHPQFEEFKKHIFKKRYSFDEYIIRTKSSAVVFNTPAVHNCHGWKLGEYITMGKAIISTPISNMLPEALEHGKNIHIVEDAGEMTNSINLLLNNKDYRKKLEDGATAYYNKYISPGKAVGLLIAKSNPGFLKSLKNF